MERVNKTRGIVLGAREWGEQDLLFFVYTEKFGKVEAVVKSAKKIKSKLVGHLPTLGLSEILFIEGRTKMKIINAYLLDNYVLKTEEDFYFLSALAEVVNKATALGERSEQFWKILFWTRATILGVDSPDEKRLALSIFLIKLATLLGYKISVNEKDDKQKQIKIMIEQVQSGNVSMKTTAQNSEQLFRFLREYYLNILERPILSFNLL
jgi:DNA repair protein RecO (recombination protein O)